MEEHFHTASAAATARLGKKLARRFGRGDCVALAGQLGAGKTVLVRGIAAGMGLVEKRLVSSPTFVLVAEYPTDPPVFHVDLYRLRSPARELAGLGLEEMLSQGLVIIEWADRAAEALPRPRWQIDIAVTGRSSRRLSLRRID
jgi:tRNA threonylcarbamoyl adenosine modification protein YjeE